MSKGIQIESCYECPLCFNQHETDGVEHGNCSYNIGPEDVSTSVLHPDCPLPDWPSASRNEVRDMFDDAVGLMGEGRGVKFLADELCAIGVIVRETEKESSLTMLASEEVLAKEWSTPDEDMAWKNLGEEPEEKREGEEKEYG